jgi:hypothetical protein
MTNLKPIHPYNTFAYWNTVNPFPEFTCSFIDTDGYEGHANYFSDKSPNELHDMQELVPVGEVYCICW